MLPGKAPRASPRPRRGWGPRRRSGDASQGPHLVTLSGVTAALDRDPFRGPVFAKDDGVQMAGMPASHLYDGGRPPWTLSSSKGGASHAW